MTGRVVVIGDALIDEIRDETGVRVRKTSDYEGHVWRKYAFGAAGEDGDGIFGDDGFPDGLRECAGEVVDAAVA